MSEVAQVALFSASATVLVALFGLIGSLIGPAALERRRAKREEKQAAIERKERLLGERNRRAEELSAALIDAIGSGDWEGWAKAEKARMRFIAVLQPGEGFAASYVSEIRECATRLSDDDARLKLALEDMYRVFAWIRGDISTTELNYRPAD